MITLKMAMPCRCVAAFLFILGLSLGNSASAARSVSHIGFTWSFSGDHAIGTFANGEPWVVGPVTITAISRDNGIADASYNGSMKNPVPETKQGFNKFAADIPQQGYDAAKNIAIALPMEFVAGDSIVSSMFGNGETLNKKIATLTVVSSPPAAGSFRPAVYGAGPHNVVFNKSQINYGYLKNLAHVAGTPSKAYIESITPSGTWLEWQGGSAGSQIGPAADMVAFGGGRGGLVNSNYGREIAIKWATVGLWLNLNNTQSDKEYAAIQMIQAGIDIAAYLKAGGSLYPDGGHKMGRKLPVLLAGLMLNDTALKAIASNPDYFQEDTQTFYVTQSDVGKYVVPPKETYIQSDVGLPEWGIRHRWEPSNDDRRVNANYRGVVAPAMSGAWLTAYVMGIQSAWNHPPAFAYMDRAKSIFGTPSTFIENMFVAYRSGGVVVPPTPKVASPLITPQTGTFDSAQTVSISCSTSSATIHYTQDGSTPSTSSAVYTAPFSVSSTKTVRAIAYASGMSASDISSSTITISVVPPSIIPGGGVFSEPVLVSLASTSQGAAIHYTTDGTTPTTTSAVYAQGIQIDSTTNVRAIAVKPGVPQSGVSSSYFIFGAYPGSATWTNIPTETRSGEFVITFEMIAAGDEVDSVVGLSNGPVTDYSNLACIVRFSPAGTIDARNGALYQATNALAYQPGVAYAVSMVVNTVTHTYDVIVKPFGGAEVLVANDFAFRSEQSGLSQINNLGFIAVAGGFSLANLGFNAVLPTPPVAPEGLHVVPPTGSP